ncbi:MAG: NfeD family protein [Microscillaceae bacterium]|nr:NfeD family protein [Microscillaceae bacterium]
MSILIGFFTLHISSALAQKTSVMVLEIRDAINPQMARYVKLALEEAENIKADYILLNMNTYGGRLDNADEIVSALLKLKKPIWVFINNNAGSAGAWISIACDSIYMTEAATFGAATVVTGDGKAAPDKYQSYMRGKMRSTASAKGRDPQIAEAMVDERIEIEGITEAGKVLTFSTDEAIKNGYCEAKVKSISDILQRNQINNYKLITYKLSTIEKIVQFFLNPYISGILLLVILGGIYFEMQTPGIGFPLVAAILASLLYFVPYYITGLAANWELMLLIIGVLLLLVEIFIIPGFGFVGISGIALTIGALALMMLDNKGFDFQFITTTEIFNSLIAVALGTIGGTIFVFLAMPQLLRSKRFKQISLQSSMDKDEGYSANTYTEELLGKVGKAYTVLRPSGKIMIEETLYDAYTQGDYIDKDSEVVVISQEGTSLMVKRN